MNIHPDNHQHPRLERVTRALVEAARQGRILLVYEGLPFECRNGWHTLDSHGVQTTLPSSQLMGLEGPVTAAAEWAAAARYVTGQSQSFESATLGEIPGDAAKQTIRQVALSLSWLSAADRQGLSLPHDLECFVTKVAQVSRPGCEDADRQEGANRVAIATGRWPGKTLRLADLEAYMQGMMPLLGIGGDMQDNMNRILYVDREAQWVKNLSKITTSLPVHVVVGVGHLAGIVTDEMVAELGFDTCEFRAHQSQVVGPRLWDRLRLHLQRDPFSIPEV
jgi:hypothetical protein